MNRSLVPSAHSQLLWLSALILLLLCPALRAQPSIYWHDAVTQQIFRTPLNGGESEVLIDPVVRRPQAIAVDSVRYKLYWMERWPATIKRSNYDGTEVEVLVEDAGYYGANLVLDLAHEYMYWHDEIGIRRARIDGSGVETVLPNTTSLFWTFAVDGNSQAVFLAGSYVLERVHLPSGKRDTLATLHDGYSNARNLAYDAASRTLFWGAKYSIGRVSADGTQLQILLQRWENDVRYASGLIFDPGSQRLYWIEWERLRSARPDGTDLQTHVTHSFWHESLTYDSATRHFFLADPRTGAIERLEPGASTLSSVLRSEIYGEMRDLQFDVAGNALYWTASALNDGRIQKLDLTTQQISDIVPDLVNPGRLALDEQDQRLYWTEPGAARIRRINMDGSHLETIHEGSVSGPLALDVPRNHVYWLDLSITDTNTVFRASLSGTNRETVAQLTQLGYNSPRSMDLEVDIEGAYLYLTSHDESQIRRVSVATGQVEDVTSTGVDKPTDLAFDMLNQTLFWVLNNTPDYWEQNDMHVLYQQNLTRQDPATPVAAVEGRRVTHFALDTRVLAGVPREGPPGALVAFPNPMRESAKLIVRVTEDQPVEIDLYDALGRHAQKLYSGRLRANTEQAIPIDAQSLGAGVYFCRIQGETYHATQRLVIVQ